MGDCRNFERGTPLNACAVIPAHNEARTLESVVRGVREHLQLAIVVDDASSDATAELARRGGAIVISFRSRRGKGAALRAGIAEACRRGYEAVLTIDGDGQHLTEEIPRFLDAVEAGADLVLGDRSAGFSSMPWQRRWTNWLMTWFLAPLTPRGLRDSQCGFRMLRASLLRGLRLVSNHFEIETEVLLEAARLGARIAQVPVSVVYGEEASKIRALPDAFRFLRLVCRCAWARPAPARKEIWEEPLRSVSAPDSRCQWTTP